MDYFSYDPDVTTEDNLQYQFFPLANGFVNFKVKAANDAHLALTIGPQESDPMYEVSHQITQPNSIERNNRYG